VTANPPRPTVPSTRPSPSVPPSIAATPTTPTPAPPTIPKIPKFPRPTATYDDRPTWRETHDRASNRLGFGDGKGCLQLLATSDPAPPDERDADERLRASCVMAAGDCPGGRAAFARFATSQAWPADRIAATLDELDLVNCTIDAPPTSRWPARARYRLHRIVATQGSCTAVLAKIRERGIVLPDRQEAARLEAECLARDGDCAGGRAKFRESFIPPGTDPSARPQLELAADETFAKSHPSCPAE